MKFTPSPAQRQAMDDAVTPLALSKELLGSFVRAIDDYNNDVERYSRHDAKMPKYQKALNLKISTTEKFLSMLDEDRSDFHLQETMGEVRPVLKEHLTTWRQLLMVTKKRRGGQVDAAEYMLGVRAVAACAAAGMEIKAGKQSSPVTEVLRVVRRWANLPALSDQSGYEFAVASIERYSSSHLAE